MTERTLPIVFFGTGPVAASSLRLLAETFIIEAVVTKPRPAHHHGSFPVLDVAEECGFRVIEVTSRKDVSEKITEEKFKSDVAVLIDFGIIVSQDVIDVFPLGIVNSHFSLLPQWRGADPITFAILSGEKRTGVSLMLLVEAMDEGPIIAFGVLELDDTFTTPMLTDRLIQLSYALLRDELPRYIEKAQRIGVPQEELSSMMTDFDYPSTPSYSRKLTKEDGIIDFTKPAAELEREIRAFIEWPKSRTTIAGKDVIIVSAHATPSQPKGVKPGSYDFVSRTNELGVVTSKGTLWIERVKPAGKSEMTIQSYLAGYGHKIKNET